MATAQSGNSSNGFDQNTITKENLEGEINANEPSQYSIFDVEGYFQPVDVCRMLADIVDEGKVIEDYEIRNIADTFRKSKRPEGVSDEYGSRVEALDAMKEILDGRYETVEKEVQYGDTCILEPEFYRLEQ